MKFKTIFFVLSLFLIFSADATVLQILHTNDTHSFLDRATHDDSIGGIARLKGLIDYYKDKMKHEGIETLTLDAGDFTEGNLYFMADFAKKSFLAYNYMGYDVVTLGNHEYLMGSKDFNNILGEIDLSFSFLAANVSFNSNCDHVKNIIKPFREISIAGIKIGILGVTTDEIYYKWRFECGKITKPIKSALLYEEILRKRKNDLIIGLTHIGLKKDIKLGLRSKEIDLIIGGHSHSVLQKPVFVKNIYGKSVPIVQAGYHTQYLGRIIVEVRPNVPIKILSYELIPVKYETKDEYMNTIVEEANKDLNELYGPGWLETIIGYSDLKIESVNGEEKWAYFITDTIKEKVKTEIAIHSPQMNGEAYPIGKISRKMLINSIPRIFDLHDKKGWSIYTANIKGVWLQLVIKLLSHSNQPLTFSGITLKSVKTPLGIKIRQILVNGKKLNPFKTYSVALTEGVIKGAAGISQYSSVILRSPTKSPFRIWSSLEEKLLSLGQNLKIENISKENHTYFPAVE